MSRGKRYSEASELEITPDLVAAARRLVGWSQSHLAGQVGVSTTTIYNFEKKGSPVKTLDLSEVRTALESAGVIFVEENGEGPGVRLRKAKPEPIAADDLNAANDE